MANSLEHEFEYKVIESHLGILTRFVNTHLEDIALALREKGQLTLTQYRNIFALPHATRGQELMEIVLLAIEASKDSCEPFFKFLGILERKGNEALKGFVNETLKPARKQFYRDLLKKAQGTSDRVYDVFISYGREDSTNTFVDMLAQKLKASSIEAVFVDRTALEVGDKWSVEMMNAIQSSKVFIPLLTKKYARSPFCNAELYTAELLQKTLFPLVFEDGWSESAAGKAVKEVVETTQYQWVSSSSLDEQYPELERKIKRILEPRTNNQESAPPAAASTICADTDALKIEDLDDVFGRVKNASTQWFNLGLALKLSYNTLTDIKDDHHDNKTRLREMIAHRLQSGSPLTWATICAALRSGTVERNDVATEIEGRKRSLTGKGNEATDSKKRRLL